MTEILNGNRFVYMKKMACGKYLPKHSECAGLKWNISHKGQPTNNRSLKYTNCWADDHARFQCEYETCCKVCKKPNHNPGDPNCANYDSAKKNIIAFSGKDDSQSNFYPCISYPSAKLLLIHERKRGEIGCASSANNGRKTDTCIFMHIIFHIRFVFKITWSVDLSKDGICIIIIKIACDLLPPTATCYHLQRLVTTYSDLLPPTVTCYHLQRLVTTYYHGADRANLWCIIRCIIRWTGQYSELWGLKVQTALLG